MSWILRDPNIYAALRQEGLWRKNYTKENSDWEYMGFTDTTHAGVSDVSVNGENIIISSSRKHFWHSIDGGNTWENTYLNYVNQENDKLYVLWVERSLHDPNVIIAQESGAGFFISSDSGYTWEFIYGGLGSSSIFEYIEWHPHKEGEVWIWGVVDFLLEGRAFILENYGVSLKYKINLKSELGLIWDLTFDVRDPDVVYALTGGSIIYKTNDGGFTWENLQIDLEVNNWLKQIVEDPRTAGSYFLSDAHNIYHSKDGFSSINLVKTFDEELFRVIIEDNILFYEVKGDIKFISLDDIDIN